MKQKKKGNDDKNNICLAKKEKLERKVRNQPTLN